MNTTSKEVSGLLCVLVDIAIRIIELHKNQKSPEDIKAIYNRIQHIKNRLEAIEGWSVKDFNDLFLSLSCYEVIKNSELFADKNVEINYDEFIKILDDTTTNIMATLPSKVSFSRRLHSDTDSKPHIQYLVPPEKHKSKKHPPSISPLFSSSSTSSPPPSLVTSKSFTCETPSSSPLRSSQSTHSEITGCPYHSPRKPHQDTKERRNSAPHPKNKDHSIRSPKRVTLEDKTPEESPSPIAISHKTSLKLNFNALELSTDKAHWRLSEPMPITSVNSSSSLSAVETEHLSESDKKVNKKNSLRRAQKKKTPETKAIDYSPQLSSRATLEIDEKIDENLADKKYPTIKKPKNRRTRTPDEIEVLEKGLKISSKVHSSPDRPRKTKNSLDKTRTKGSQTDRITTRNSTPDKIKSSAKSSDKFSPPPLTERKHTAEPATGKKSRRWSFSEEFLSEEERNKFKKMLKKTKNLKNEEERNFSDDDKPKKREKRKRKLLPLPKDDESLEGNGEMKNRRKRDLEKLEVEYGKTSGAVLLSNPAYSTSWKAHQLTLDLSNEEMDIIVNSWKLVLGKQVLTEYDAKESGATQFFEVFNDKYIMAFPKSRQLFYEKSEHRRAKTVVKMMLFMNLCVENKDNFVHKLHRLGGKHEIYGVKMIDYEQFAVSVSGVFKHLLEDQFTEQMEMVWVTFIKQLGNLMVESGRILKEETLHGIVDVKIKREGSWKKAVMVLNIETLSFYQLDKFPKQIFTVMVSCINDIDKLNYFEHTNPPSTSGLELSLSSYRYPNIWICSSHPITAIWKSELLWRMQAYDSLGHTEAKNLKTL